MFKMEGKDEKYFRMKKLLASSFKWKEKMKPILE